MQNDVGILLLFFFILSFGMMGKASKTCHSTIQVMAQAKVAQQNRAWGRGEEEEKAYLRQGRTAHRKSDQPGRGLPQPSPVRWLIPTNRLGLGWLLENHH